jgi:hypothetical protein
MPADPGPLQRGEYLRSEHLSGVNLRCQGSEHSSRAAVLGMTAFVDLAGTQR